MKPSSFSPKVPALLLFTVIALHLIGAVVLLPQLTFKADLVVQADGDPRIAAAQEVEKAFPTPNPLVFLVPAAEGIEAPPAQDRLKALVTALEAENLPLRSALSVKRSGSLTEAFRSQPLYRSLFLNGSGDTWVVWVPTDGDGQAEAARAATVVNRFPGVVPGGEPWVRYLMDRALARNLAVLFPLSLVVVALVFLVLVRRPGQALWLTLLSCLPALDVLFLFPLLGLSFDFTTVLAPLLILALCKKYNLWVHQHIRIHGADLKRLLADRGRAIAWSASISSLGFASLWLSPLPSLRVLGLLLVVGLAATLFWALVAAPVVARAFPGPIENAPPEAAPGPRRPWVTAALGVALVLALPGWGSLTTALQWRDYLSPTTDEARSLGQFEALFPAWQEAVLRLEVPEEGGWLEPGRWQALAAQVDRWRTSHPGVRIWSVQDAVAGVDAEPGEALEFLPPATETGKLIDGRRSALVVRFDYPSSALGDGSAQALMASASHDATSSLPGVTATWGGPVHRHLLGMEAFLAGEWGSSLSFFLVTGLVIMVRLRSWKKGLLALAPALAASAFFLGLSGWLHWPISPATALVIAACIGQTTDDGLLWSLLPLTVDMRRFFLQATGLLCSALLVLAFSSFSNINQAALLTIGSLLFSTAVVLWVLPWRTRP